ncbi:MAG: DUF6434 domain-containing protein [Paracoccaceae bacterium]
MTRDNRTEYRPNIHTITTGVELRRWYWRKDELVQYARQLQLKTTSDKFNILDRIAHFLDTSETKFPGDQKPRRTSSFDWHSEQLSKCTIITDNYKSSQNVRRFFKENIGSSFKFNIAFMEWIKANVGKTLNDACLAYVNIRGLEKSAGFQTEIKSHNQFNQYTRDFLDDNPRLNMSDVRRVWALKIQKPSESGRHVYSKTDLNLGG